ncbi:hypothetical protein ACQP04_02330 [Pseudonocardia halophobica]|uniref:hypothetical protein n=1 Tax=Pseudonocardia halophobica TaxID=29401 RepID=UPI003D89CE97
MSDDLTYQVIPRDPVSTLVLTGALHRTSLAELVTTVQKLLLDHGHLLVDLTGLRVRWPPAIRAFTTALARSADGPRHGWSCSPPMTR